MIEPMRDPGALTFGVLLKQLRKQAGLTQRALAAALGYSDSLISSLETAQRQPDLDAVVTRSKARSITVEALVQTLIVQFDTGAVGPDPLLDLFANKPELPNRAVEDALHTCQTQPPP